MKKLFSVLVILTLLLTAVSPAFAMDYYSGQGVVGPVTGNYGYPQPYAGEQAQYNAYSYPYGQYGSYGQQSVDSAAAAAGAGTVTGYIGSAASGYFGQQYTENSSYSLPPATQPYSYQQPQPQVQPYPTMPPNYQPAYSATATDIPSAAQPQMVSLNYSPGNYSSGGVSSMTFYNGSTAKLEGQIYTRPGYIQTGWTEVDGGAKMYNLYQAIVMNRNITLYPYMEIVNTAVYLTVEVSGPGSVLLNGGTVWSGWSGKLEPGQSYTFSFSPQQNNYVYSILFGGSYRSFNISGNKFMVTYEMMQGCNQTMTVRFNSVYSSPKTGDNSNIVLWSILGGVSVIALGTLFVIRRKHK